LRTASILPMLAKTTEMVWPGLSGPAGVMDVKKDEW
jgi:hypothetical protein